MTGRSAVTTFTRTPTAMAEFAGKWRVDYVEVQQKLGWMKESTAVSYAVALRVHIEPFFGPMRLSDMTLPHVRDFMKASARPNGGTTKAGPRNTTKPRG